MKRQIRQGLFETNSSSTHSLQVTNGTLDDAYNYVHDRINKKYNKHQNGSACDPNDYLIKLDDDSNILLLKGFDFEDGDESYCVYCIMKSWMAKVQYLAMLIKTNETDIKEIKEFWEEHEDEYNEISKTPNFYNSEKYKKLLSKVPKIQSTFVYKAFINAIMATCYSHGYNIAKVSMDTDGFHTKWIEYDETGNYFTPEIFALSDEEIQQKFIDLLSDDNKIMYYIDEAYNPYGAASITVY